MATSDQKKMNSDKLEVLTEAMPLTKHLPAWVGVNDKTLWDLLDLIFKVSIPVVLTVWGSLQTYNANQIARTQEIRNQARSQDEQHQKLIADYLEAMTKFMADPKQKSELGIREVIKARTLNTLSQLSGDPNQSDQKGRSTTEGQLFNFILGREDLADVTSSTQEELLRNDSERKGQLLKFLFDAGLIRKCSSTDTTDKAFPEKGLVAKERCQNEIFKLDGAKLANVSSEFPMRLQGVNLYRARLNEAKLRDIDLTEAILARAYFIKAELIGAQLGRAQMDYASLEEANLSDANLLDAILTNARLSGANLSGADLSGADLSGANLRNAKLDRAILKNVKLQGADLTGASLEKVKDFSGVTCDGGTRFSPNLNRTGLGMGKSCQQN